MCTPHIRSNGESTLNRTTDMRKLGPYTSASYRGFRDCIKIWWEGHIGLYKDHANFTQAHKSSWKVRGT